MSEKTSKKLEVFEQIKSKLVLSDEELNTMYNDLKKAYEDRGATPTEDMILNRLYAYLTPSLRSTATKHTAIFLGLEDNFGFNQITDKVKFDSIKQYQENKENAIFNKVVEIQKDENKTINICEYDEDGNVTKVLRTEQNPNYGKEVVIPLWHYVDGIKVADFKLGKPITSFDYSATGYCFNEVDSKLELKSINLRGERREELLKEAKIFSNKKVEFMGTDKENGSINDSKYFNIKVLDEKEQDIPKLINKYAKDKCLNIKGVEEFYKKNVEIIRNLPVFVRGTVRSIVISETKDSNIINFSDIGYNKEFTVYLPKTLELPPQSATNVIFGGRLRFSEKNADRPFSLNAFMVYTPQENLNFSLPESIKKHMIVEHSGDVNKSQKLLNEVKELSEEW